MTNNVEGYITEDQFVDWAFRLPQGVLTHHLDFHIVPIDITTEAHKMFSSDEQQVG